MAKTYSNASKTPHPHLWKVTAWFLLASAIVLFILDFLHPFGNEVLEDCFLISAYVCLIVSYALLFIKSPFATVDHDAGTLSTNESKKPVIISDIDRIMKHFDKKGRLRYINIHEAGVRFVTIRLRKPVLEALIQDLTGINPDIQIKEVDYL